MCAPNFESRSNRKRTANGRVIVAPALAWRLPGIKGPPDQVERNTRMPTWQMRTSAVFWIYETVTFHPVESINDAAPAFVGAHCVAPADLISRTSVASGRPERPVPIENSITSPA